MRLTSVLQEESLRLLANAADRGWRLDVLAKRIPALIDCILALGPFPVRAELTPLPAPFYTVTIRRGSGTVPSGFRWSGCSVYLLLADELP